MKRCSLPVFIFCLSGIIAAAASPDPPLPPAFGAVGGAVSDRQVPGAVALVQRPGRQPKVWAGGLADPTGGRSMTPKTICWLASLTKPLTAAATMVLVDEGKLSLDDPIEKWLPRFAHQTDSEGKHPIIRVADLLRHTSGIDDGPPGRPRYFFEARWVNQKLDDVANRLADTTIAFAPGSKSHYSNGAPYITGRIIELASGVPFDQFVQTRIFDPLAMTDSYFKLDASLADRLAVTQRRDNSGTSDFFRYDPAWDMALAMPDGGWFGTAADVAKFAKMFLDRDGKVLSDRAIDAMLTPGLGDFGLGWNVRPDGCFWHTGSSGTFVFAHPNTGVVGVLLCQVQDRGAVDPLRERFELLVAQPSPPTRQPLIPRIIFDTDFRADCDDVGALAVLHKLADAGHCEIAGAIATTTGPHIVAAIDAVNTYYGRGDLPIGLSAVEHTEHFDPYAPTIGDPTLYPSDATNQTAPDAVTLYRRLLADSPDQSVVVVINGYATAAAGLIQSDPHHAGDDIALSGLELADAKVRLMVQMGGVRPGHSDSFNLGHDPGAAVYVNENWPGPIVYSQPGRDIRAGDGLTDPQNNPVAKAFELYPGAGPRGVIGDRQCWDEIATIYAVVGENWMGRQVWKQSPRGDIRFTVRGIVNVKTPVKDEAVDNQVLPGAPFESDHWRTYLIQVADKKWTADQIETLMIAPPGH